MMLEEQVKKLKKLKKKKKKKTKKLKKKKKGSCELEGGVVSTSLSSRCEGPFLKLNLNFQRSTFNFQLTLVDRHDMGGQRGQGQGHRPEFGCRDLH